MKLSFLLFRKNLLLNILIAAQICASAICGFIAVGVIANSWLYYNLTEDISYSYVYMPESEDVYYTDSAVAQYCASGEITLSRSRNEQIWGYNPSAVTAQAAYSLREYDIDNVFTLGGIASDAMKAQLKKGSWFSDKAQDNVIECVIVGDVSEFPIGSIIDGAEYTVEIDFSGEEVAAQFAIKNCYKFKVVGTCGQSAEILDFTTSVQPANSLLIEDMFSTVTYKEEGFFRRLSSREVTVSDTDEKPSVTILCSAQALYGSQLGDSEKISSGINALFAFDGSVTEERRAEILSDLKNEAGVTDLQTARDTAYITAKNTVNGYLPILLCFLAMAVAGIVCVAVLNMIKNKKDFTIYTILGMDTKKGAQILAVYTCFVLALSLLFAFIVFLIISAAGIVPWASMSRGAPAVIFAVCDFAISAILIFVSSFPLLKKYQFNGAE